MRLLRRRHHQSYPRFADTGADAPALAIEAIAHDRGLSYVELDVVGEANYQAALEALAGPTDEDGKHQLVDVTLRCEPLNPYDTNAVRVEAMGQLVGYIPRPTAAVLSPAMQSACGGIVEGLGIIVGGWSGPEDEGHYGIRCWLARKDLERIHVYCDEVRRPVARSTSRRTVGR